MRGTRLIGAILGAVTSIAGVALLVFVALNGLANELWNAFFYQTTVFGAMFGGIGYAAARRDRMNRGVWVTTIAGALMMVESSSVVAIAWMLRDQPELVASIHDATVAPIDLPRPVALVSLFERGWLASLGGFLTFGLLLFPNGRLPSKRWRSVGYASAVGISAFTITNLIEGLPDSRVRMQEMSTNGPVATVKLLAMMLVGVCALAAVASLIARYRSETSETRHQIRWILLGGGVFVICAVPAMWLAADGDVAIANLVTFVTTPLVIAAYGIAVLKYRLYDIDVVLNRSVVFGALALFITGMYAAIVVGLGSLIGDQSNTGLAVVATAFVAVVFEPVRARVQHWANVLVYGRKATPYEVLAGMSSTEAVSEDRLQSSVSLLGEGTGAANVTIWVGSEDRRIAASWPDGSDSGEVDDWDLAVPMAHDGEPVGLVTVRKRKGDHPSDQDERLVAEFAGQASLAVANALLNERLRIRLDEIARSRRRIIAAQDEARRRLERDLHDGAQQQLVGLKIKVGLARRLAETEGAQTVVQVLHALESDAAAAVRTLQELARGIYPPLLEAEGLPAALSAHVAKMPIPVEFEDRAAGRCDRETEAAVYFCVLEALTNVAKYSQATKASVTITQSDGELSFSVVDDGVGFDPAAGRRGSGISGMADRLDTIGGRLDISSSASGTAVRGWVPAAPEVESLERIHAAVG